VQKEEEEEEEDAISRWR